jgi:hypothetical protein
MSNRTQDQVSALAELKVAHEAQIDVLLDDKQEDIDKLIRFFRIVEGPDWLRPDGTQDTFLVHVHGHVPSSCCVPINGISARVMMVSHPTAHYAHISELRSYMYHRECSAAYLAWTCGRPQRSLFAFLPGRCNCPVHEVQDGRGIGSTWRKIPLDVPRMWNPTRDTLEAFATIQQNARYPESGEVPVYGLAFEPV